MPRGAAWGRERTFGLPRGRGWNRTRGSARGRGRNRGAWVVPEGADFSGGSGPVGRGRGRRDAGGAAFHRVRAGRRRDAGDRRGGPAGETERRGWIPGGARGGGGRAR